MGSKNLLIILMVTGSSILQAQRLPSFTHEADSVFKNLNKRYITTGILYDRVYPTAMLHVFNTAFFDTTNVQHFKQAYYELYNAKYQKTGMVKPDLADKRMKQITATGKVPIGIINFKFNQVDTNSLVDNLLESHDGIFYDVPLRSRSPYWTKQVSVISPLVDSTEGLQVKFETSPALYFQNTGNTIISLKADFDDGSGLVNIGLKNTIPINYSSSGRKIIKFIVKYKDNTHSTIYAYLKVGEPKSVAFRSSAVSCYREDTIRATIPFTDYENNKFRGTGYARYYFSTSAPCNGSVKKPIIILDGFDPGDKRSISELYDVYLNNPDRYKFGDEMRSKGYDIVVLNFPEYINEFGNTIDGGADYIERNAFVLVRLINMLNAQLKANGSTEKLVIIGPSMGGMISRYALAYMEKKKMPHNTRLWISLDAPQNGANIPIGAQKYLEFFANNGNKGAQETLDQQLNSPAAKQQLLHHYLSYSEVASGAPGFRDRFMQALSNNGVYGSKGFPVIPRKVALVDGSLSGAIQSNSTACQEVLNSKSYLVINLFLFKARLFRIAEASVYFSGSYGNACTVLSASQLSKGSVIAHGAAPATSVSIDIAPGGSRTSFTTLADQAGGYSEFFQFLLELGSYTAFNVYNGSHSFIPTKSALAFKGTNKDLAESVYGRNLVCTGETPFDTYYGGTKNLEHSYIDSGMANFAIAEITGTQRDPSHLASLPLAYISGSDDFCESGGIYSLQGGSIAPGTTLEWSVSPAIAGINSGQNSTRVQLSKLSSGTATLSLQLTSPCGLNQKLTKTFVIRGDSSSKYTIYANPVACNNEYVYFFLDQLPGVTNYNWTWPAGWTYVYGQGTYSLSLLTGSSSGSVGVKVTTACDSAASTVTKYIQVNNCGFVMNAFPNPTVSEVTITTEQKKSSGPGLVPGKIYRLEVMDLFGNIRKKFKYSSGQTNIRLNLGTLNNGTCIIRVYNGKVWAHKTIVVIH